jgi:predicted membrane-bound spermidine synthase
VSERALRTTIGACLFASGVAGLVYEVVWSRWLTDLVGASSSAQIVVITTYMAGLALGSWLFGGLADRVKRPERLYAALEVGIGLYAAAFPLLVKLAEMPYLALARGRYPESAGAITALRVALAVALLVPPTALMGGTLPAAVRFLYGATADGASVRRTVARLYFLNSLGASLGAALTTFVLLPGLGLAGGGLVAVALNALAALAALRLSRRVGPVARAVVPDATEPPLPDRAARLALAAVTLSGFAALALEVAWIRLFALVLGSSAHAFAVMLSAFILAIALGSGLVSRPAASKGWLRLDASDPLRLLSMLLAGGVLAMALTLPLVERAIWVFQRLGGAMPRSSAGWTAWQMAQFFGCLGLMLVPTTCLGAALPVAARAASRGAASLGHSVGTTYAVNTVGTLLGAVAANFALPVLSLRGLFLAALAVDLAAAGVALAGAQRPLSRRAPVLGVAAVAGLLLAMLSPAWRYPILAGGALRSRGRIAGGFEQFAQTLTRSRVVYARDGSTATTTVLDTADTPSIRSLFVNGKADASTDPGDLGTNVLLGHLPMVLDPDARDALVIGVASGVTCGAVLAHEDVRVDAVDLLPEMTEVAPLFSSANGDALANPRLTLTIDDAKTFVKLAPRKYDVIVSEPSNPWMVGVGGLFAEEFYADVSHALRPGGLFLQWCHTYEMSDELMAVVARTLAARFPRVYAFEYESDVLFIASQEPIPVRPDRWKARLTPAVRDSLRKAGAPDTLAVARTRIAFAKEPTP